MAQLVEWSRPTPEIRGSNHGQNFINQLDYRKDENKEEEAGNGPSLKKRYDCNISRGMHEYLKGSATE